jgi:hypothetical protein
MPKSTPAVAADDAVTTYARARAAFARAEQELDHYAAGVLGIARAFVQDPRHFGFSGIEPKLPPEVLAAKRSLGGPDIRPAREWPTAQEIQEAVARWHGARAAVEAAYEAIPRALRDAVVPPPGAR